MIRGAPLHRLLIVLPLLLYVAGCARLFGSYDIAPNGLATREDRLRHMLAHGQAVNANTQLATGKTLPADDVLRALYQGVVAYHAGDYTESARILDVAGELADDRITKSLSRSALSLVSNDLVLPYEPSTTERVLIPYYAALARLQLGDIDGAAVEARRLSMLLQIDDDDARLDPALRATLRYFAASVFAVAGEEDDAGVAYRNATALGSTLPEPQASADSGTVVFVLEQGFVAHRVEQGLAVMILPEEIDAITGGEGAGRAATAALVAARVLNHATHPANLSHDRRIGTLFVPPPEHTPRKRRRVKTVCSERTIPADSAAATPAQTVKECKEVEEEVEELPYLLKVSWPVYRTDVPTTRTVRLLCAEDTITFADRADVSRAVINEFERDRLLIIARTIARGTAKLALTKGAERKLEEKNETASKILGLLGNVGNVLLERADTRSWHLLPGAISIAQLRLPAGEHTVTLELGEQRNVSIGPVRVRAGEVSIVPVRAW